MKSFLKSHLSQNWRINEGEKSDNFLDKLTDFLSRNVNKRPKSRGRRQKFCKSIVTNLNDTAKGMNTMIVSFAHNSPVTFGLRSVIRLLKQEKLHSIFMDINLLRSSSFALFFGLYGATAGIPIYVFRGFSNKIAKSVNLPSIQAMGIQSNGDSEELLSLADSMLLPAILCDQIELDGGRKFIPPQVIVPGMKLKK